MNYKDFIQQVEKMTGKLSDSELRQILCQMAENVSVHGRSDFLEQLTVRTSSVQKTGKKQRETLTKRVDELAEHIDDGYFCTGWGWDEAFHDERDFGDESWADEMDRLLAVCRKLVLEEAYPLAEALYGKLLGALDGGLASVLVEPGNRT